jgi:hypothetical protein
MSDEDVRLKLAEVCDSIKAQLLEKNQRYGNSALNPVRIMSRASADEQLRVRIDDKLSRLVRGSAEIVEDEDVVRDLIGYLVLLLVCRETTAKEGV